MDLFRSVLSRMQQHKTFRDSCLAQDSAARVLDAQLKDAMRRERKPLCLVSASTLTVVYDGSPSDVLKAFEALGEDVHPASVCLSVRAVMRSLRKQQENGERPRKRAKKSETTSASVLGS